MQLAASSKSPMLSIDQVQGANHLNRHVIHKFLTAGFLSFSDEELAATLVDIESLAQDFKLCSGGDWLLEHMPKVVDRLRQSNFPMHWFTRQNQGQYQHFFKLVQQGVLDPVKEYCEGNDGLRAIQSVDKHSKMSPLHLAARNGNVELTQFFLKKKLSANIRDKYLKTPLHYACEFFQYDVVELLLSNGAKPTDRDHRGWTALHYAIQSNDSEIITQILKKDTNMVHFVDYGRRSPLHLAVMQRKDNTKIVDLLMRHGADRQMVDIDNNTPFQLALINQQKWAVDLFREDHHPKKNNFVKPDYADFSTTSKSSNTKFFNNRQPRKASQGLTTPTPNQRKFRVSSAKNKGKNFYMSSATSDINNRESFNNSPTLKKGQQTQSQQFDTSAKSYKRVRPKEISFKMDKLGRQSFMSKNTMQDPEVERLMIESLEFGQKLKDKDEQYLAIMKRKDQEIVRLMQMKQTVDYQELEKLRIDYKNSVEILQKYSQEQIALESKVSQLEQQNQEYGQTFKLKDAQISQLSTELEKITKKYREIQDLEAQLKQDKAESVKKDTTIFELQDQLRNASEDKKVLVSKFQEQTNEDQKFKKQVNEQSSKIIELQTEVQIFQDKQYQTSQLLALEQQQNKDLTKKLESQTSLTEEHFTKKKKLEALQADVQKKTLKLEESQLQIQNKSEEIKKLKIELEAQQYQAQMLGQEMVQFKDNLGKLQAKQNPDLNKIINEQELEMDKLRTKVQQLSSLQKGNTDQATVEKMEQQALTIREQAIMIETLKTQNPSVELTEQLNVRSAVIQEQEIIIKKLQEQLQSQQPEGFEGMEEADFFVEKIWQQYDLDQSNTLDMNEAFKFLQDLIYEMNMVQSSENLVNAFKALDTDQSGHIDKQEMRTFVIKYLKHCKEQEQLRKLNEYDNYVNKIVDEIWRKYDSDFSGFLEPQECEAFFQDLAQEINNDVHYRLNDEQLYKAFSLMDEDFSGSIDKQEMKAFIIKFVLPKPDQPKVEQREIMQEVDNQQDGFDKNEEQLKIKENIILQQENTIKSLKLQARNAENLEQEVQQLQEQLAYSESTNKNKASNTDKLQDQVKLLKEQLAQSEAANKARNDENLQEEVMLLREQLAQSEAANKTQAKDQNKLKKEIQLLKDKLDHAEGHHECEEAQEELHEEINQLQEKKMNTKAKLTKTKSQLVDEQAKNVKYEKKIAKLQQQLSSLEDQQPNEQDSQKSVVNALKQWIQLNDKAKELVIEIKQKEKSKDGLSAEVKNKELGPILKQIGYKISKQDVKILIGCLDDKNERFDPFVLYQLVFDKGIAEQYRSQTVNQLKTTISQEGDAFDTFQPKERTRPGGGRVGSKDKNSRQKDKVVGSFDAGISEPKPAPKKQFDPFGMGNDDEIEEDFQIEEDYLDEEIPDEPLDDNPQAQFNFGFENKQDGSFDPFQVNQGFDPLGSGGFDPLNMDGKSKKNRPTSAKKLGDDIKSDPYEGIDLSGSFNRPKDFAKPFEHQSPEEQRQTLQAFGVSSQSILKQVGEQKKLGNITFGQEIIYTSKDVNTQAKKYSEKNIGDIRDKNQKAKDFMQQKENEIMAQMKSQKQQELMRYMEQQEQKIRLPPSFMITRKPEEPPVEIQPIQEEVNQDLSPIEKFKRAVRKVKSINAFKQLFPQKMKGLSQTLSQIETMELPVYSPTLNDLCSMINGFLKAQKITHEEVFDFYKDKILMEIDKGFCKLLKGYLQIKLNQHDIQLLKNYLKSNGYGSALTKKKFVTLIKESPKLDKPQAQQTWQKILVQIQDKLGLNPTEKFFKYLATTVDESCWNYLQDKECYSLPKMKMIIKSIIHLSNEEVENLLIWFDKNRLGRITVADIQKAIVVEQQIQNTVRYNSKYLVSDIIFTLIAVLEEQNTDLRSLAKKIDLNKNMMMSGQELVNGINMLQVFQSKMNIQEIQLFDDWFKSSKARRSEVNVRELEELIENLKPYKFDDDEIKHLISFVRKNAQQFIEIRNKQSHNQKMSRVEFIDTVLASGAEGGSVEELIKISQRLAGLVDPELDGYINFEYLNKLIAGVNPLLKAVVVKTVNIPCTATELLRPFVNTLKNACENDPAKLDEKYDGYDVDQSRLMDFDEFLMLFKDNSNYQLLDEDAAEIRKYLVANFQRASLKRDEFQGLIFEQFEVKKRIPIQILKEQIRQKDVSFDPELRALIGKDEAFEFGYGVFTQLYKAIDTLLDRTVSMSEMKRHLLDTVDQNEIDLRQMTFFVRAIDELFGDDSGFIPGKLVKKNFKFESSGPVTLKEFKTGPTYIPPARITVFEFFRTMAGKYDSVTDMDYLGKFTQKMGDYLVDMEEMGGILNEHFGFALKPEHRDSLMKQLIVMKQRSNLKKSEFNLFIDWAVGNNENLAGLFTEGLEPKKPSKEIDPVQGRDQKLYLSLMKVLDEQTQGPDGKKIRKEINMLAFKQLVVDACQALFKEKQVKDPYLSQATLDQATMLCEMANDDANPNKIYGVVQVDDSLLSVIDQYRQLI